jgi:hypothetical protein
MGKGVQAWKEDKLDKSKANFVTPHHDSISLPELLRFVALGLCDKGIFHKSNLNLHEPPFIRTKL